MKRSFELHPRLASDSLFVSSLQLCDLRLVNDRRYPWFLLVPRRLDIVELIDLSAADEATLWAESRHLQQTIMQVFAPDKLNVAVIGNVVPQLHLHHVARTINDETWPAPVWGKGEAIPYSAEEKSEIVQAVMQEMNENHGAKRC